MKKAVIIASCIFMFFVAGCTSNHAEPPQADPDTIENSEGEAPNGTEEVNGTAEDYFPLYINEKYAYAGEGMEYASYTVYADYVDKETNKIQTRTNNGGTEVVKVIQIKDGSVTQLFAREGAYYRDNLLSDSDTESREILLKEPIAEGTNWTLNDGRNRSITNTDLTLETPAGKYTEVIEVITEGEESTIKEYYAKGTGLIKSIFNSEGVEVSSTLEDIEKDANYEKPFEIFYPSDDEKLHIETKNITFKTNDITRLKMEEVLKQKPSNKKLGAISSANTKINSMYLGSENIAYVDFSQDLIDEMNAGSGFESLILQSIVNTIGNYYTVDRVYLTIEGEPYESGHILLEKGELLDVNMDNVVH